MKHYFFFILCLMGLLFSPISMDDAQATTTKGANVPLDTCTNTKGGFFDYNKDGEVQKMLQEVVEEIYKDVNKTAGQLYTSFVTPQAAFFGIGSYRQVIQGLLTMAVVFFAISFTFGFISLTGWQVVMLLFKMGFVLWVVSPSSAILAQAVPTNNNMANMLLGGFSIQHMLYVFFIDVPNEMIEIMINIGNGTPNAPVTGNVARPFQLLDQIVQVVFSPRMFVTIVGTFSTGPYGIMMAMALLWSVFQLFMCLLKAVQIYVLAIVMKAILIGLSPVFFPMILFSRTKQVFQGWINQLVNFSLQPILLFAFLAFFANLVASAARDMLPEDDVHMCYVKAGNQAATPFDYHGWKYMCCDAGGGNCQPYEGTWTQQGPVDCPGGPTFPMSVVNVIVFLLLTHIMKQLATVSVGIASELSSGLMNLGSIDNAVNRWFGTAGGPSHFDPKQRVGR